MNNKNTRLRRLAEAVLFETFGEEPEPGHIQYGMHDRPIESDPAIEMPLTADPLASTESLLNLPPVDDPDYAPTSVSELKLAMFALAEEVPSEDVERLFRAVRRKVDELAAPVAMEEAVIKGGGYFGDDDEEGFDDLDDLEKGASSRFEAADDDEGMGLEAMASLMGKSVSGVNQYVARILKKVKTMTEDPRLSTAIDMAASDYARYMGKWLEDPSVEEELMSNPEDLRALDGFRYYVNATVIEPALVEMRREGLQSAVDKLAALNLPPEALKIVKRTVKNQLTGRSKPDVRAVKRALERTFPSGADKAYDKYLQMAGDIEAAAEPPEGAMATVGMTLYNDMTEQSKKKAFVAAIEEEDDLSVG